MTQTVEVSFKGTRRDFFLWNDEQEPLRLKEAVVVEAERGLDFGRVHTAGEIAEKKCAGACTGCAVGATAPPAMRPVVRRASQEEIRTANELRQNEEEARRKVIDKVRQHSLDMKVSDAEWQWDRGKLTIFFTAEKRVDFRALVRDLAALFRTRIELRQIGVRDEAARLKGVGRCGREYCCSTWLTELSPVSLALAKDQHLSLNPAQISGGCGRLLCCLKYEHEFYVASRKRFPREGKTLQTSRGPEKVVAVDIFRERVFLRHEDQGSRIIPLVQLRDEMEGAHEQIAVATPPPVPAASSPPPTSPRETTGPSSQPAAEPGAGPRRRRRRRGRRGRGGAGEGPESPPTES